MSLSVFPGALDGAIATWLQAQGGAKLRVKSGQLSESYRKGQSSGQVDLAAYLTTRMPATYAAVRRVLEDISPHFTPRSILDVGAGPGTASWAALANWPEIKSVTMVETDARFVELAANLAEQSHLAPLINATIIRANIAQATTKAELVIAAYVFAELAERQAADAALKLWQQAEQALVIIEPGTPRGFARIRAARQALLAAGAHMIGPCTHANACPMAGSDWCHFNVRLARSREHMHAKAAHVPFEDEPFSWIAASHQPATLASARIVAPPLVEKHAITFKLCAASGLANQVIARRDKAAYKRYRKLAWGDVISASPEQ